MEDAVRKVYDRAKGSYYKETQQVDSTWYGIKQDTLRAPIQLMQSSGVVGNLTRILWQVEAKNFKPRYDPEEGKAPYETWKGKDAQYFQIPPHHKLVLQLARYIIRFDQEERQMQAAALSKESKDKIIKQGEARGTALWMFFSEMLSQVPYSNMKAFGHMRKFAQMTAVEQKRTFKTQQAHFDLEFKDSAPHEVEKLINDQKGLEQIREDPLFVSGSQYKNANNEREKQIRPSNYTKRELKKAVLRITANMSVPNKFEKSNLMILKNDFVTLAKVDQEVQERLQLLKQFVRDIAQARERKQKKQVDIAQTNLDVKDEGDGVRQLLQSFMGAIWREERTGF